MVRWVLMYYSSISMKWLRHEPDFATFEEALEFGAKVQARMWRVEPVDANKTESE